MTLFLTRERSKNQASANGSLRRRRGSTLLITMIISGIVFLLSISLFSLSSGSTQIAYQAMQKVQATELAEAGDHALYAQIQNALYASTYTSSANITSGTLGDTGSYSAVLVRTSSPVLPPASDMTTTAQSGTVQTTTETMVANNPAATPPSTTTTVTITKTDTSTSPAIKISSTSKSLMTQVYIFTMEGRGTAPNGVKSSAQATFESTLTTQSGLNYFTFPNGALVSNGNIQLQGNSKTQDPSGTTLHGAGALANGVVSSVGSAYYIDGQIAVAPASYNTSLAALSPVNNPSSSLTQLAAPIPFPSSSLISNITSTWLSAAQSSGTTYSSSSLPGTITGSCVINGNIDMTHGMNLTLDPGTNPQPVVVYVNGNIDYANGNGVITNKGVILVCTGTFYLGNNGTYTCTQMPNSLLASLSTSSTAITVTGNGTMTVGVVQALNGGVLLGGNGTLTGSIEAGKAGANGGIVLQGNPTVIYPPGLNANSQGDTNNPPPPHYTAGTFSQWVATL